MDDYSKFASWYEETFDEAYSNKLKEAKCCHRPKCAVEAAVARETFFVDCWKATENTDRLKETACMWRSVAENAKKINCTDMQCAAIAAEESTKKAVNAWSQAGCAACKVSEFYEKLLHMFICRGDESNESLLKESAKAAEKNYAVALKAAHNSCRFAERSTKNAIKSAKKIINQNGCASNLLDCQGNILDIEKNMHEINCSGLGGTDSSCNSNGVENFLNSANKKVDSFVCHAVNDIQKLIMDAARNIETFKDCTSKDINKLITGRNCTSCKKDVDKCCCKINFCCMDSKKSGACTPYGKQSKGTPLSKCIPCDGCPPCDPCDPNAPNTVACFPGWGPFINRMEMRPIDSFKLISNRNTQTTVAKYFCKREEFTEESVKTVIELVNDCEDGADGTKEGGKGKDTSKGNEARKSKGKDSEKPKQSEQEAVDKKKSQKQSAASESESSATTTKSKGRGKKKGRRKKGKPSRKSSGRKTKSKKRGGSKKSAGRKSRSSSSGTSANKSKSKGHKKKGKKSKGKRSKKKGSKPSAGKKSKSKGSKKSKGGKGKKSKSSQGKRSKSKSSKGKKRVKWIHIGQPEVDNVQSGRSGLHRSMEDTENTMMTYVNSPNIAPGSVNPALPKNYISNFNPEAYSNPEFSHINMNPNMHITKSSSDTTERLIEKSEKAARRAEKLKKKADESKIKFEKTETELNNFIKQRKRTSPLNVNKKKKLKEVIAKKRNNLINLKEKLDKDVCEAAEANRLSLISELKLREALAKYN